MKKLIALILTSVAAFAATSTHTLTVFPQIPDWSVTNSIPKWNSADGTLNSVTISISANTLNAFFAESRDTEARETQARSVFGVTASSGSLSAVASTTNSHVETLSAFDGVIDYSGTSGFSVVKSSTASASTTTTTVAPFVGTGTVPVTASATASGEYEGPGDYFFFLQSQASALVVVTYDFTPNCPPCEDEDDCKPRVKPPTKDDDCDDRRDKSRRNRR
jgi:hypothetical protein